ncbi:hypothetical protein OCU04_012050 [Sclerotinia nivalis]|uniref:Uncharacterized protein n=1 Tax=Sclerotinia nivalis TaxID=352851 RepID=A0A9X0DFR1_9HELO|nr:hypothetical protein OCU04_012050 [Sclerotinia nivalis]
MRFQSLIFLPLISAILAFSPIKSHIPSLSSLHFLPRGGFTTRAIAISQYLRATRTNKENIPPPLVSLTNINTTFVAKSIPGGYINAPSAASSLRGNMQTVVLLGTLSLFIA